MRISYWLRNDWASESKAARSSSGVGDSTKRALVLSASACRKVRSVPKPRPTV